jgi:DNA-binding MarR family transcriptional regulator
MADELIELMTKFGAVVRQYRASQMGKITESLRLSERDVAILEYLDQRERATFHDIAAMLHVSDLQRTSRSTVSQAVTTLWRDRGLVLKESNPADQRQPLVSLTEKGKKLVAEVRKVQRDILARLRVAMKPEKAESLVLCKVFRRGLQNFEQYVNERKSEP